MYAIRIQISVAIITYCLVAIVQTNFNDVKDQFGPLIPGLFD